MLKIVFSLALQSSGYIILNQPQYPIFQQADLKLVHLFMQKHNEIKDLLHKHIQLVMHSQ